MILVASPLIGVTQTSNLDSLKNLLQSETGSAKVDVLNNLLGEYVCVNDTSFLDYYVQTSVLVDDLNYTKGEIQMLKHYGTFKYCQGDIDSAIFYYGKVAEIGEQNEFYQDAGRMLSNLGYIYQMLGKYDSSNTYFDRALAHGKNVSDSVLIGGVLVGQGITYQHAGHLESALQNYQEASTIAELVGHQRLVLTAKQNMATINYDHFPDRLKKGDFEETLALAREINDVRNELGALEFLGYISADSGDYNMALAYFEEGLQINKQVNDMNVEILLLQGQAVVHRKMSEFNKSIELSNAAIKVSNNSGLHSQLALLYRLNAQNNLDLKEYTKAKDYSLMAIDLRNEDEQLTYIVDAYGVLAEAYIKLGMADKAYQAQKTGNELNNQILDAEKAKQLTEMQTKYETEKKEAEINKLSQQATIQALELSQQRYLTFGLGGLVILLAGGASLVYRQRKLKQDKKLADLELAEAKKRLEVEKQYRESELKALRSQMNPHFIFNALNSIQEYIVTNEKKLAGKYLGKFADLMRMYLKHSQSKLITVHEEIEALDIYLELEKVRFNDTLNYQLKTDELNGADLMNIPPLLIQPFVENSLKHGLLHKASDRKLIVTFSNEKDDDVVCCVIEDNGIGRAKSAEINKMRRPDHESFATGAINTRLELMNESLDRPIEVETVDLHDEAGESCGTRVVLNIPAIDNF